MTPKKCFESGAVRLPIHICGCLLSRRGVVGRTKDHRFRYKTSIPVSCPNLKRNGCLAASKHPKKAECWKGWGDSAQAEVSQTDQNRPREEMREGKDPI